MTNNLHKIARAAHIRTFSYVIMLFRYLCLLSYTMNNWRTHTFCTLSTVLFHNKQPYPEYDIGKILKHTIWVYLEDSYAYNRLQMTALVSQVSSTREKKICEEF